MCLRRSIYGVRCNLSAARLLMVVYRLAGFISVDVGILVGQIGNDIDVDMVLMKENGTLLMMITSHVAFDFCCGCCLLPTWPCVLMVDVGIMLMMLVVLMLLNVEIMSGITLSMSGLALLELAVVC